MAGFCRARISAIALYPACDTTSALVARVDDKKLMVTLTENVTALPASLAAAGFALEASGRIVLRYSQSRAEIGRLLDVIRAAGFTIRDVSSEEADLEDIFLRLTGPEQGRR